MGFTHYYRNKRAFTDSEWKALTQDVKNLLAGCGVPIGNGHGDIGSAPSFTNATIMFNGVGDDSHETACVNKAASDFEFCKTARKPYDKVVVAFYKLIRKYDPNVELSSDGGDEVFGGDTTGVKIKVDGKWTYSAGEFDVEVGDTVILPPTPYTHGNNWKGKVTQIGSGYTGYTKTILGVENVSKKTPEQKTSTLEQRIADYLAADFCLNEKAAKKGARGVLNIVQEHFSS